jgi:hypothetical protein
MAGIDHPVSAAGPPGGEVDSESEKGEGDYDPVLSNIIYAKPAPLIMLVFINQGVSYARHSGS